MPLFRVRVLSGLFLLLSISASAAQSASGPAPIIWDMPAFSAAPEDLRHAAASVQADKDADVTVLLNDDRYTFDREGRQVEVFRSIYRIENEEGVKGWAESSGRWEPWHQSKPEIRARVITADGAVHTLDPATLSDVPVHENSPETYSDERSLGGPLPAIAVGAIVEEEIATRDTAPFFSAGVVQRLVLSRGVPVNKTRVVISRPEELALKFVLQKMPNARVTKSSHDGVETIQIEDGPYEAVSERLEFVPPDVITGPQVEFSTGSSWQQIASTYAGIANAKLRVADVQPLVAKLNLKSAARMDIIRRLTATLHKDVRYTGVEFGDSSLIPQFPSETLKRKYGDCKDKAALLVTMLHAAGLPAYLALLDSGPGPDINTELPGMGMFDHAIVYVPGQGSDPDLWIDATAQYTQVGYLPSADYGRWALIVDPATAALKKIPEFTADQNLHRETREFKLAEYGPASIVEINEEIGPWEASYRDYYAGDPKELREKSEKYVKDTYLADSLDSVVKTDPEDLDKPLKVTYSAKGRRGYTDRENAMVYIFPAAIFNSLPDYFVTAEEPKKDKEQEKDAPKPRTVDWRFDPFTTEWHYKITAPPGFKLRALPPNKEETLASARFTQKFSANPEGTYAEAVLRFESGKSRLTVAEAVALRDAVVKAREADGISITFDQIGYSLLSAGKVKESLAAYRQLSELHPKEALHKTQLANAYLTAGLGDRARELARQAIALEPNSPSAYAALAWILQHDSIGRRFGRGFDYQGALDAYRKALQLDPKEKEPQIKGVRADYAILLEHDSEGQRYSPKALLEQAIAQFAELKKLDEEQGKKYDDYVLYDLWYAGKYKELTEKISALPGSDDRRSLLIAALTAVDGPEAGVKRSLEVTSDEKARSKVLVSAGYLLLRARHYAEAAELYSAGARLQEDGSKVMATAELLRKTRPYPQLKMEPSDPRSPIFWSMVYALDSSSGTNGIAKVASSRALELHTQKEIADEFRKNNDGAKMSLEATGVSPVVALDLALSNAKYNVEGDDATGYRIVLQAPNAKPQTFFVVREKDQYKIVNFAAPTDVGVEILDRVDRNDLAGARKWLDWTRDTMRLGGGDDPLAGSLFPRFWTKGQDADAEKMRMAALSLLVNSDFIAKKITDLLHARESAKEAGDRERLDLALALAFAKLKRWPDLLSRAQDLMTAHPDSERAFDLATLALRNMGRLDAWQKLVQEQLQKHPEEPEYVRAQARLALYQGEVARSRSILKGLIDSGKADNNDLNEYGWFALLPPAKVDADAIEVVEQANNLTQNSNFAIMHTLVCLYAEQGRTKQARELLLKAMHAGSLREPDSAVWLALARIAEQYGEFESARQMYAKVEKPEIDSPESNYAIAQHSLSSLRQVAGTAVKSGGQ